MPTVPTHFCPIISYDTNIPSLTPLIPPLWVYIYSHIGFTQLRVGTVGTLCKQLCYRIISVYRTPLRVGKMGRQGRHFAYPDVKNAYPHRQRVGRGVGTLELF